jgi:predicted nucleic acid-binding protein
VTASFALDTNIVIYALTDGPKSDIALLLLDTGPRISIQLLNEFANSSRNKRKLEWAEIDELLSVIISLSKSIRPIDFELHRRGLLIANRYQLGFYDAMIVAAALLDGCETLYSEDMHHGLVIDRTLTILNPFREPE